MKSIRPKIIPVLLEGQVLIVCAGKTPVPSFYRRRTVCAKGIVTRKAPENVLCVQGPGVEEEMLGSGVGCWRGGGCEEVVGSTGQANFYCVAKSTAVALLPC